jgi:ionotropic glutamate receptor
VWLLLTTVLINSYSGTVISYLTVPKMKAPIETFEDLIACEDVGIILQPRFRYRQADFVTIVLYSSLCYFRKTRSLFVRKAKSGTLKTLGDQARNYPERLFTDQSKINARLLTGRFAFPTVNNPTFAISNFIIHQRFEINFFFPGSDFLQILRHQSIAEGRHLPFSRHRSFAISKRILVDCFA